MSEDDKGSKWKVVEVLLTSPNLILVLSTILVLLGTAGGITYKQWFPIDQVGWRIFIVILGALLFGLYFLLPNKPAKRLTERSIKSLEIKINYPENNAVITGKTEVRGTISKPIPDGYELRVLRGYPWGGFVPHGHCFYDPDKKTWHVQQFDMGGEKNDVRTIEVWLVGRDGHLLLETWATDHEVHKETNSRLQKLAPTEGLTWLKPIKGGTTDMFRCD